MAFQRVHTRPQPITCHIGYVRKLGTIANAKQYVDGHWCLLLSWKQWDWITRHKWSSAPIIVQGGVHSIIYVNSMKHLSFNLNLPAFTASPNPVQNLQATKTTRQVPLSPLHGFDGWEPIDKITEGIITLGSCDNSHTNGPPIIHHIHHHCGRCQ